MESDKKELSRETIKRLVREQKDEINAHILYKKIAKHIKDPNNREIVLKMSQDELKHYHRLKEITGKNIRYSKLQVTVQYLLIRTFGLTFGIKLFENAESNAIDSYKNESEVLSFMDELADDEERHEKELIEMIDEERLRYAGSVVLGLNDALVELTGALAGFTMAFQNSRLIGLTGLITGISASFSMAASEYLSTRHDGGENAGKSSLYTGMAYVFTVLFLVFPFFIFTNPFISLGTTLLLAVMIIAAFNFYISVAKEYKFGVRFLEMTVISFGVAGISFLIGILIKKYIGLDL